MPVLSSYCKAYPASRFAEYPGWKHPTVAEPSTQPPTAASSETYYFLHDNFVVTKGAFSDVNVIFESTSPEWQSFCQNTLGFFPPR